MICGAVEGRRGKRGHVTRGPQGAARQTRGQTTPVGSHYEERIAADDDQGRERLVRYCTRPAFALARIELPLDGRIVYLLKTPRRGRTHRVMCAMEFMARLVALIPTPKIPLVRYHGVFAPRSSWRSLVTPKPPAAPRSLNRASARCTRVARVHVARTSISGSRDAPHVVVVGVAFV
ncbi:transposase [Sorangium sp. So ce128]|uniref:transposase n=1 Tax=Sorangium sp. So ce128 TaxID=3133281 RepID=UPI003F641FDA